MAAFEWSERLGTSVSQIDDQHRFLFRLVNDYLFAEEAGIAPSILVDVVSCLKSYVGFHFSEEEQMMEAVGYSGLQQHKSEHDRLKNDVDRIIELLSSGELPQNDFGTFLTEWLQRHIMERDVEFADFYRQTLTR